MSEKFKASLSVLRTKFIDHKTYLRQPDIFDNS